MANTWDKWLHTLVQANPQAFLDWIIPGARAIGTRSEKLSKKELEVDILIEAIIEGQKAFVHTEFQTYNDPMMAERLLRYNILARWEYKVPTLSCVIYLLKDGTVQLSPLVWGFPGEKEVVRFHFVSIEIAKISAEEVLARGQIGLLPLVPLTKGGTKRAMIEQVLTDLTEAGQDQLALVGFSLAALVLRRQDEAELDWLIERFNTMHDLLQENPIYQEILRQGKEKGLQEGLQEGAIKALRQAVIEMTQEHCPELTDLAKEQVQHLSDPAALRQLLIRISWTTKDSQARQILMEITNPSVSDS